MAVRLPTLLPPFDFFDVISQSQSSFFRLFNQAYEGSVNLLFVSEMPFSKMLRKFELSISGLKRASELDLGRFTCY